MSNYQTFLFLVLASGKFLGALGSGIGTWSFLPFIFIFGQCEIFLPTVELESFEYKQKKVLVGSDNVYHPR